MLLKAKSVLHNAAATRFMCVVFDCIFTNVLCSSLRSLAAAKVQPKFFSIIFESFFIFAYTPPYQNFQIFKKIWIWKTYLERTRILHHRDAKFCGSQNTQKKLRENKKASKHGVSKIVLSRCLLSPDFLKSFFATHNNIFFKTT